MTRFGFWFILPLLAVLSACQSCGASSYGSPNCDVETITIGCGEPVDAQPVKIESDPEEAYEWLAYLQVITVNKDSIAEYSAGGVAIGTLGMDVEALAASTEYDLVLTVEHFCDAFILTQSMMYAYEPDGTRHTAMPIFHDESTDLCLLMIDGPWVGNTLSTFLDPNEVPLQAEIENYGNPSGRFQGETGMPTLEYRAFPEYHVTFRYNGYMAGMYSDVLFAHSIPTMQGQSGSPILYNGMIIGLVSLVDGRGSHVGFAVRANRIFEFLNRAGVDVDYVTSL